MISNLSDVLSESGKGMKRSAIRELLKLMKKPGIISFGGGFPAPESFPVEDLKAVTQEVLDEEGALALQYGTTEGDDTLREVLAERYQAMGCHIFKHNVMITTASQQALEILSKIFIDRGDKIVCGLPSYLGGLSSFKSFGAESVGIQFDEYGMRSDLLKQALETLRRNGERAKFIYVIPDFQNPAGITIPAERRNEIIELAREHDILIIEDSPYREIRFEGQDEPLMYSLDNTGQVITLGTFSKTFVPGFRIGWVVAHEDIIDKMVTAKQSADLCTSPFVQKIAARYMQKGLFEKNIRHIIADYREKRDVMLEAFRKYMPDGVTWTKPEGGLFLFLRLPEHMDTEQLFEKAIEKNVAYVMGGIFHCDDSGKNTMRLNFSYVSKEQNVEGVKRLAQVIKEAM